MAVCSEITSLADLRLQHAEAEAAYRRLMLGQQPRVIIDSNGERIEFTSVSADKLRLYVVELQRRLNAMLGCTGGPGVTRPIGFFF